MAKRSDIENIVAYDNSEFFGKMVTHRVAVNGFHYLTVWTPLTKCKSKKNLCTFVKSAEYGDSDYESLKKKVLDGDKWVMVDRWDALPNKQVREEFDTED